MNNSNASFVQKDRHTSVNVLVNSLHKEQINYKCAYYDLRTKGI